MAVGREDRVLPDASDGIKREDADRAERELDPDTIRRLKETSRPDITVGGAELAGQAIAAGLVDECHLFLGPIVVGAGERALPDNVLTQLELLDERRFKSGVVHLHYRVSA